MTTKSSLISTAEKKLLRNIRVWINVGALGSASRVRTRAVSVAAPVMLKDALAIARPAGFRPLRQTTHPASCGQS